MVFQNIREKVASAPRQKRKKDGKVGSTRGRKPRPELIKATFKITQKQKILLAELSKKDERCVDQSFLIREAIEAYLAYR